MSNRKFTAEEKALIHRTFMVDAQGKLASNDDLDLFIATCERTGLDPFARQIMASSRNTQRDGKWVTVWTWLVTIDGLRKIAVDSGDYEGQEGPWWCGKDGIWHEVWTDTKPCYAAKVTVHRKGFRVGLSGIAKYESYVQKKKDGTPNNVWQNLGDHMTAKCAEALALRRAYPNEMAGLYTQDEMAQAGFEPMKAEHIEIKPDPIEWTDAEYAEAKNLLNDLGQSLMDFDVPEDEQKVILAKPASTIGDERGFENWQNRLHNYSQRTLAKFRVPA